MGNYTVASYMASYTVGNEPVASYSTVGTVLGNGKVSENGKVLGSGKTVRKRSTLFMGA